MICLKEGEDKVSQRQIGNRGSERTITMIIWSSQKDSGIQSSQLDEMALKIIQLVKERSSEHNYLASLSWSFKTKHQALE